jgi:predicted GH43/DUF377 family glycosyl hydrolase
MRFNENPLITPKDIKPTRDDFEILCVLNPAVTQYKDEILLLLRVAERPIQQKGFISVGTIDLERSDGNYRLQHFGAGDPLLKADDPRVISYDGITYLTSMSHLRLARSKDGKHFTVDPKPFIWPSGAEEEFGTEDARITCIDGIYYIYYVAVCRYGFSTVVVKTTDFKSCKRIGNIAPGVNKDVAIFPEKINGLYYALTRPDTGFFAKPSMWIASSPDLVYWGQHQHLLGTRKGMWDSSRIGAGAVPIKTPKGWLEIYHGADMKHRYSLGITLLDLENPATVRSRPNDTILEPEMNYEINGFYSNVVFTNGAVPAAQNSDEIYLYYGAADQCVCGTTFSISDLLSKCKN